MSISYYVFYCFCCIIFRSKSPAFQYWAPSIIAHYPKIDCNPPIVAKKPVHLLTIFRNTLFRKILKLGQYCFKRCRLSENWLVSKPLLQNSYDQCSIVVMARTSEIGKNSHRHIELESLRNENLRVWFCQPPRPPIHVAAILGKKVHPSSKYKCKEIKLIACVEAVYIQKAGIRGVQTPQKNRIFGKKVPENAKTTNSVLR